MASSDSEQQLTNQIQCLRSGCKVAEKKSNQQSCGEWIREKKTPVTTKPNWHYWLCVVAHYVPT
jgi:hypothetical protein